MTTLLTYSLKTGLNQRPRNTSASSSAAAAIHPVPPPPSAHKSARDDDSIGREIMPFSNSNSINSSPFDCWAKMIPRKLEGGLPPRSPPLGGGDRKRRTRQAYKVLYPSSEEPSSRPHRAEPRTQPRKEEVRQHVVSQPRYGTSCLTVRPNTNDNSGQWATCNNPTAPRNDGKTTARRTVRFSPQNETRLLHRRLTPTERSATWYNRTDLLRMKTEASVVVDMMRRGDYIDEYGSTSITTRGLERHASDVAWNERRERKRNVTNVVLDEQRRGREEGSKGGFRPNVRMASLAVSWRSRDIAKAAAEWDEYVVRYDGKRYPRSGKYQITEEPVQVSRVVSYEDDEEEEDEDTYDESSSRSSSPEPRPAPQQSPSNNKRSVEEVYFGEEGYDVFVGDENSPPPLHSSGHHQFFDSQQQGYEVSYSQPDMQYGGCHHQAYQQLQHHSVHASYNNRYQRGDRYEPLAEIQAERSVVCR